MGVFSCTAALWISPQGESLARRATRGQSMVELALILPLLALLTMLIVDFGRIFFVHEAIANAAREGARYCALHPGDTIGVQTRVSGEDGAGVAGATSSGCTNPGGGQPVTVTVQATFTPVTPMICALVCDGVTTMTVSASSTMAAW
jgi:hypothetical protein